MFGCILAIKHSNMSNSRRKFIAGAVAVGVTSAASALPKLPKQKKIPLVHHVFFWLKNSRSAEDTQKLIEGLKSLRAIPTIKMLHIGVPADTEVRPVIDSSYDVSELMFFDNTADQKVYQDHPLHQKFIADYSHLWEKVVVYDVREV
jgi:hypothetical protein